MGRPKKKHTAPTQPTLRAEGSSRKRTPLNQFDPAAGGDIYEPEIIVAMRVAKGITQWQVKWKGYDTRANTWEPIEHLAGCEDMIAAFTEKKREEDEAFQKAADAIKAKKRAEEEEHRRQAVAEAAAAPVRAAVDAARGAARAMDLDLHDTGKLAVTVCACVRMNALLSGACMASCTRGRCSTAAEAGEHSF